MSTGRIGWKGRIVLALLWVNFVFLWIHVYRNTWAADYRDSISYLSVLMAAYGILVTVWILHNVRIYRKKGPRRAVRLLKYVGDKDALKNQIGYRTDPKMTQEIVIVVVDGLKTFNGVQPEPVRFIPPVSA